MPQFFAEHVPNDLDDFTRGYLEAVEWLLPEPCDSEGNMTGTLMDLRAKLRGFGRDTIRRAKASCRAFCKANAADLETYCEVTGRDMASAGVDFWLTRNGHGAGFWDRGDHECLKRLTEAAHGYGDCDVYVERGWIRFY